MVNFVDGAHKLYVNGDLKLTSTVTCSLGDRIFAIGGEQNPGKPIARYQGYMSDFYFADGQVLEPTAFGEDLNGTWAPLDNSVVKTNVSDFGDNGFYLPFDPTQTGQVYSNGTTSGTTQSSWTTAFDGSDSTGQKTDENGQASLTFGSSIPFTNKLRIRGKVNTADTSLKVYVNNTPVPFANNNDLQWADVTSLITSPITSVAVEGNGGSNTTTLTAIEVDGELLVDHSSIGVDMSGNKNNFHDQNFGIGETSQVWSSLVANSADPSAGFNGGSGEAEGQAANSTIEFTPNFGNGSFKVEVVVNDIDSSPNNIVTIDGTQLTAGTPGAFRVYSGTVTSFNTMTVTNSSASKPNFRSVVVDGVKLIDPSFLDTVIDTPMKNYATLESGSNGNLVGSGALTYTGESGKSYYYETNGGAVTSLAPVGNAASGTHNFGQQPFVSPRITSQDLDAGTVTLADKKFDGSQAWSTSGDIDAWSNVFDGDISNGISNIVGDKQAATWNIGSGNAIPGPVQIYLNNGTGTGWLTINGNAIDLDASGPNQNQWLSVPGVSELYSIALSQGNEWGSITAIKVNGKLLVDSSVYNTWDTSQNWSLNFTQEDGAAWDSDDHVINGFDGSFSTRCNGAAGVFGVLTLPAGVNLSTGSSGVEFAIGKIQGSHSAYTYEWEIGVDTGTFSVPQNSNGFTSIPGTENKTISSSNPLKIRNASGGLSLGALKVNDKILVDSGAGTFDTLFEPLTVDPIKRTTEKTDPLYVVFDGDGKVTGLQEAPTLFTPIVGADKTTFELNFPDTFSGEIGNGKTPDDTLETGTSITVEVKYKVDDLLDGKQTSNGITPQDPDEEPDEPDYDPPDMSGLRFDSTRKTYLQGSKGSNTFTFSCWIKATGSRQRILDCQKSGGTTFISTDTSGKLFFGNNGTNVLSGPTLMKNQWVHIVVNNNPTGKCSLFVNGESVDSKTGESSLVWNDNLLIIGGNGDSPPNGFGDQYLSDVYFVDGKAVSASAFGYTSESGRWTPLDSEDVRVNIDKAHPADPVQPYDSRANTDQVWSGAVIGNSFEADRDPTKMFDGDTSTFTGNGSNGWYWDPSGYSLIGTLEVMLENSANSVTVTRDGSDTEYTGTGGQYIDCGTMEGVTRVTFTSTINSSSYCKAIKVGGRLLVDQGVWDNSQNWSGGTITGVGAATSGPWTELFDSNLTTRPGPNSGDFYKIEFTPAIDTTGVECEIYGSKGSGSGVLKVNGSDFTFTNTTDTWVTIPTGNALTSLEFPAAGSANPAIIFGVRVDGVLLVDPGAQWDTSQVWSTDVSSTNGYADQRQPIKAFNNVLNTNDYCYPNPGGTATFELNLTGVTKFRVNAGKDAGNNWGTVKIDGTDITSAFSADPSNANAVWIDLTSVIPGNGNITNFTITSTGSGSENVARIAGFEVNGALLVDAAPTWNSSQVWSDVVSSSDTNFQFPFSNGFNGITTAGGSVTNECAGWTSLGPVTLTFPAGLTVTNKVRIFYASGLGNQCDISVDIGGTTLTSNTTGYGGESTFTGTSGSLNSITLTSSGGGIRFYGIEVDGEILVDGGFGGNGFYLPFDPAQTGANYSSQVSGDIGTGKGAEYMFDGDLSGSSACSTSVLNQTLTWDTSLAVANTVEIFVTTGGGTTYPVVLTGSGGTVTENVPGGYSPGWFSMDASSIGTLTKMEWTRGGSGQSCEVRGVKIDGKILVDHSNIGVDNSGNKNNFHDQNFITADNSNRSQVWSNGGDDSELNTSSSWADAFDGNIPIQQTASNTAYTLAGSSSTYTFPAPITGKLTIYASSGTSGGTANGTLTIGGSTQTVNNTDTSQKGYTFTLSGATALAITGGSTGLEIIYMMLDGKLLVDKSVNVDTVLDTPVKDYATIAGEANGGLVVVNKNSGNIGSKPTLPSDGKIYSEFYCQIAGTIYLNEAGTVFFDSTGAANNMTPSSTSGWSDGDVIGVAIDVAAGSYELFINGTSDGTYSASPDDPALYGAGTTATVANNFGQQPYVHTPPEGYDGLFTEYSLPAGPLTLEQYQGVQNAISQFSVDVATRRTTLKAAKQAARTKLVALGLTEEEVTALSLSL